MAETCDQSDPGPGRPATIEDAVDHSSAAHAVGRSAPAAIATTVGTDASNNSSQQHALVVKYEQDEEDQLAPESLAVSPNSTSQISSQSQQPSIKNNAVNATAESMLGSNGTHDPQSKAPSSVSHQQLQQILLQQQQLQRNRPAHPVQDQQTAANGRPSVSSSPNRCALCGTANTPLWRREPAGKAICNACGK